MARWRAIHRQDTTAKPLIAEAKALGADYLPLDGIIDGILFYRQRVILVDWKSPKAKRTDRQMKLVLAGWPVWFISSSAELRKLLLEKAA